MQAPRPPKAMSPKDIARVRAKLNCSQTVFAMMLNISPRTVQAWEQGSCRAAVDQMLAMLNDKSTRAAIEAESKRTATDEGNTDSSRFVRIENRILIIEAMLIARTVGQDTSKLGGFVAIINQALPNAARVVFDWRVTNQLSEFEAFYFENFMRQTLIGVLDTTVVLITKVLDDKARSRSAMSYSRSTARPLTSDATFSCVTSAPRHRSH